MATEDQRPELPLNTVASCAFEGLGSDLEMAEDIEPSVKGDVTIEEIIRKAKLMNAAEAFECRAANLLDDGERVSLSELLSVYDQLLVSCELGATAEEIQALLGERLPEFHDWMHGQTMGLCPEHGQVVYRIDLERFLAGSRYFD